MLRTRTVDVKQECRLCTVVGQAGEGWAFNGPLLRVLVSVGGREVLGEKWFGGFGVPEGGREGKIDFLEATVANMLNGFGYTRW